MVHSCALFPLYSTILIWGKQRIIQRSVYCFASGASKCLYGFVSFCWCNPHPSRGRQLFLFTSEIATTKMQSADTVAPADSQPLRVCQSGCFLESGSLLPPPAALRLMQIQQLLCLQKSTLNVFFNFFCSRGWSEGACFLHLLREDHRSSLKVENFLPKGVSFYPSISPFIWGHMKAMPVNLSCQPTEKEGNHSKKKIFCQRRV